MKKFLKSSRGVVMMEYIVLGCFAVAITVVAVLALGKVYNNGLITMGWATLGATQHAATVQNGAEEFFDDDTAKVLQYGNDLAQGHISKLGTEVDYEVYPTN